MNWDQIAGKWTQYRVAIREKWEKLTDTDIDRIAGHRDQLIAILQERCGVEKEKAQKEVDEYIRTLPERIDQPASLRFFEETVRGKHVIAADGQTIGEVADLMLDCEQWQVQSLHLKLTSDAADKLGVERGRFHAGTVNVPISAIQSVGDTVILKVPTVELPLTLASRAATR